MSLTDEQRAKLAAFSGRLETHAINRNVEREQQRVAKKEEIRKLETCTECGSERVYRACGHGKDLNWFSFRGSERNGYLPYVCNLGGGDDLEIAVCLECGQAQGTWPVEDPVFEEDED